MNRRLLGLVVVLAASVASAQTTIYQGKDASGNPVFTDQPRKGDKPVELPPVNTTPGGPSLSTTPRSERFAGYTVSLSAPGSVPNAYVPVEVQIAIEPQLREGDLWRLSIDGEFVAAGRESGYTVESLEMGRHTLTLDIADASGQVLTSAAPVDVFVQFPKGGGDKGGRTRPVRPAPN